MNEILAVIYYCFWPHSDSEDPDEEL